LPRDYISSSPDALRAFILPQFAHAKRSFNLFLLVLARGEEVFLNLFLAYTRSRARRERERKERERAEREREERERVLPATSNFLLLTCYLVPATFYLLPATCNLLFATGTCYVLPATYYLQPATCNLQLATCNQLPSTC